MNGRLSGLFIFSAHFFSRYPLSINSSGAWLVRNYRHSPFRLIKKLISMRCCCCCCVAISTTIVMCSISHNANAENVYLSVCVDQVKIVPHSIINNLFCATIHWNCVSIEVLKWHLNDMLLFVHDSHFFLTQSVICFYESCKNARYSPNRRTATIFRNSPVSMK